MTETIHIPINTLTNEQLMQVGLDDRIFNLLEIYGASVNNLYIIKNDNVLPIAYFDPETGFEFRFTAFLGGWEDVSQIKRFGKQLALHQEKSLGN